MIAWFVLPFLAAVTAGSVLGLAYAGWIAREAHSAGRPWLADLCPGVGMCLSALSVVALMLYVLHKAGALP